MRPPLPVAVQFRSAASGSGFVLIFKNDSDSTLSFTATLEHQGQREEKKFAIQVQPHSVYELETSQGWIAQSGDRISLTSSDYRTWRGAIPWSWRSAVLYQPLRTVGAFIADSAAFARRCRIPDLKLQPDINAAMLRASQFSIGRLGEKPVMAASGSVGVLAPIACSRVVVIGRSYAMTVLCVSFIGSAGCISAGVVRWLSWLIPLVGLLICALCGGWLVGRATIILVLRKHCASKRGHGRQHHNRAPGNAVSHVSSWVNQRFNDTPRGLPLEQVKTLPSCKRVRPVSVLAND
jgi:hypothetical protein